MSESIPRVIHYCWFGSSPMGPKEIKCVESWQRHFPGYEIKCWDESNFDFTDCRYATQAYKEGKWAFLSDYARFKILSEYGGLYFDTDVEVIKSMDDIIDAGPFMGFEVNSCPQSYGTINPGVGMGTTPGLPFFTEIVAYYETLDFSETKSGISIKTIVEIVTEKLIAHGLRQCDGIQNIEGLTLYPSEFFNPKDYQTGEINITDSTRSIHHFNMSWVRGSVRLERRLVSLLAKARINCSYSRAAAKILSIILTLDVARARSILMKAGF